MNKTILIPLFAALLTSHVSLAKSRPPPSAVEAYMNYYEFAKTNTDYEKEKVHFSKEKVFEVEERIKDYVEKSGAGRDDAIEMFMKMSQRMAECGELDFKGESTDGAESTLFFIVSDVCSGGGDYIHKVTMKHDIDWKIHEILTIVD